MAIEGPFRASINVNKDLYFGSTFIGVMIERFMKKENREALWTFLRAEYAARHVDGVEALIDKVKPLWDGFAELPDRAPGPLGRVPRAHDAEVNKLCGLCATVPR